MITLKQILLEDKITVDLKRPSISEKEVDSEELKKGIKVELEHTNDPMVAKLIALHHLAENSRYYSNLEKIHKENKKMKLKNIIKEFDTPQGGERTNLKNQIFNLGELDLRHFIGFILGTIWTKGKADAQTIKDALEDAKKFSK